MAAILITGQDKAKLQKRINIGEIRFVKDEAELRKYQCVSCNSVALYNYTPTCKHLYCDKCHGKINGNGTKNNVLDKEIAQLEVFCMNKNLGCLEEIALHNYLAHVKKCKFNRRKLLPKLYNENIFAVYKEQTNEEIRKLKEENEALNAKIQEIEQSLKEDLSSVTERLDTVTEDQKQNMENLKSNMREVDGKVTEITESLVEKQSSLDEMLEKMGSTINEEMPSMKGKLMKSEETIMELVEKVSNTQMNSHFINEPASTDFVWKISGIRKIEREWSEGIMTEVLSDTFQTNDFGYTMQCKLAYNNTLNSFNILFHFDPNLPNHAPAVYAHQRSLSLQDQSKFGEDHVKRIDTPGFGNCQVKEWMSGFHNDTWMFPVEVLDPKLPYVVNNSIIVKIRIDPLTKMYKSVFSKNGTLLWKLDNYRERKRAYIDGVTKFLRSPCFYTHEQGYRVHLGLHVRCKEISFYLSFDKGEFDEYLPSAFPHQATLIVMAQPGKPEEKLEDWLHTQKSNETTSNLVAVIPTMELEDRPYLLNDNIVFKVIVEC